ncbi:TonB-dependent receptor [Sphingobium sp.]|uniref:TonB-dependent receptor n=1 Tax=Sphingobium sp. TaxID=1912891 RepID=UPI002BB4673C|nr:TonB-dependent receptor [Sphingobium sp.]HUD92940.1 TonB-dependent receptor [Sphingobium sp.]
MRKLARRSIGLTTGVALATLSCALVSPAAAQTGPDQFNPQATATEATVQDIVVTGSRIKRDGYSAPTPETVVTTANIEAAARPNVADYLNTLPQLAAGSTPRTATVNISSGSAGSNFLNLRGLGPTRTLVLLDGRRVVGATDAGLVDANTLPSALISRVDIVTGGASAAYGSDAVAGVVNFVLDTAFKGVKLGLQSGISTYGDAFRWRADGAFGTDFADQRGHFIISATYADARGQQAAADRPWYSGRKIIGNPAFAPDNGQPSLINVENVNIGNSAPGGLITTGILRGTEFINGGATRRHIFGVASGMYSIGGDRNDLGFQIPLEVPVEQYNGFARASFEVSDAFKLFAEAIYARSRATPDSIPNFYFGNLTIQRDNAFLPDDLRARMTAAGQTNFTFGSTFDDIGRMRPLNVRELQRYAIGAEGNLGGSWRYDLYGTYGRSNISVDVRHDSIPANLRRAIDAVRNGSNQIICRVNQVTVTDPSCVPFNPFGIGVNTPAALNYVSGTSSLRQRIEQKVVAGTVQGEPFSTWAGPVSLAIGGEYREESVSSTVDAGSQSSIYLTGNYKPTRGSYDVYEGFAEVIVPLAKDMPFLNKLDFNGALRKTHYSTSGSVTTWKAGLTWEPIPDIRFRGTRSRDIRAGNLSELFQAGITSAGQTVVDRTTGAQTGGITAITVGNPNLQPERADSLTLGVVLQPRFLPSFNLSFDYFNIKIRDAIQTLTAQQVVDRCVAGNTGLCAEITRNAAGTITQIFRRPVNLAVEREKGFDIEVSYRTDLTAISESWNASLTLRSLITHIDTRSTFDGVLLDEAAGENSGSVPKWRIVNTVNYQQGAFTGYLSTRSVSSGVYDHLFTSATLANNRIPGATYLDIGVTVKVPGMGGTTEFFINADNVLNTDPVPVAGQNQQFLTPGVNAALYDVLGREFKVGFRARF